MPIRILASSIFGLALLLCSSLHAHNPCDFLVRVRAIYMLLNPSGQTLNAIPGASAAPSNSGTLEADLSLFFTRHIAGEMILGTTHHNLEGTGPLDMQRLGETWLVPATGTLQWHFLPCSCFQPYVGVGLNYSFFINTKSSLPGIEIGLSNYFGPAFQVGFDYMVTSRWLFNFDVKYVPARTDAQLVGAINETIRIKLDPVVFGLGVGYVF